MTAGMSSMPPLRAVVLLGIGLALAPILIGLPIMAVAAGEILAWAHGRSVGVSETAGWIAILLLVGAGVTGIVLGLSMSTPLELYFGDDGPAFGTTAIAAPIAAGLLFAPLAFAPSLALFESRAAWIVEAIWLAAHAGALRVAMLGVQLGAHAALPFALTWAVAELIDDDLVLIAFVAGMALTVLAGPMSLRRVARTFERARRSASDTERAGPALSALARLCLVPLVVPLAFVALAAAAPLPMQRAPMFEGGTGLPAAIPGTALRMERDFRRVTIRRDDERAGEEASIVTTIPVARYLWDERARFDRIVYRGRPALRLTVAGAYDDHAHSAIIDEHGARLDAELGDRIGARMPPVVFLLLAFASLLGVVLAVRLGMVQARVRELAAIVAGGESARALGLVSGTLRLTGAAVHLAGRRLRAAGGASIEAEAGALRIALPEASVEVVASDPALGTEVPDGTAVLLLSRGARLGGVSLREAAAPFPPGGALVLGDPGAARVALVRRSIRPLALLALSLGATLTAAAIAIGIASS